MSVASDVINHLPALSFVMLPGMPGPSVAGHVFISSDQLCPLAIVIVVKISAAGGVVWRQESSPLGAKYFQLKLYGQDSPMSGNYEVSYGSASGQSDVHTLRTTNGTFNDDRFHIVVARFTGAASGIITGLELSVDETTVTTPETDELLIGGSAYLGGPDSVNPPVGEIAEVIGWGTCGSVTKTFLSDPDLSLLRGYIRAKFAL